jgi:RNA polymerase sigma-70 factor (ECF subfamily)
MAHDSEPSERNLVHLARSGDHQALAALFHSCEAPTKRNIRKRLSPAVRRRLSESDVFQEAIMTAARRIDTFEFRGDGSFQRWLGGIAENTRRDAVRRHTHAAKRSVRAEITRDARPETRHAEGAGATPSRIAMAKEMRDLIASALADMPEDYRAVIQLLERRRTSREEAGELMGRSANAVKKLHARALAELARRLGLDEGTSS